MKTFEFKDLKRIADTVTYDNGFTTFYVNVLITDIHFYCNLFNLCLNFSYFFMLYEKK